jgi:hypothetical protein
MLYINFILKVLLLDGKFTKAIQRRGQLGQQHGQRIHSFDSDRTPYACWLLVSGFLTEMTQRIHSVRASRFLHFYPNLHI